jgi:hypothetical protein
MDFKKLMQTMQDIEEGCDPSIQECGDMPAAIIQGGAPAEESLNMNVTINSKGADGIRDLMNILKGIGGDSDTEPKDIPDDAEIVIGDSFKNSKAGDQGSKVFDQNAIIFTGDDFASKGGGALKTNGGENPRRNHFHESLVTNLFSLYEDVKSRKH